MEIKKCDFCGAIHEPGDELARYTKFTVGFNTYGTGYGSRNFDMCGDCQKERGVEPNRTKGQEDRATLEEVLRDIISEEIQAATGI